jgi:hypothetical protein
LLQVNDYQYVLLKIPYDTVLFRVFIAVLYDASYLARGNSTTMSSCYHVFSAQLHKKKNQLASISVHL